MNKLFLLAFCFLFFSTYSEIIGFAQSIHEIQDCMLYLSPGVCLFCRKGFLVSEDRSLCLEKQKLENAQKYKIKILNEFDSKYSEYRIFIQPGYLTIDKISARDFPLKPYQRIRSQFNIQGDRSFSWSYEFNFTYNYPQEVQDIIFSIKKSNKVREDGDKLIFYYYDEYQESQDVEMILTWMRSTDDLTGAYNLTIPGQPDIIFVSLSDYQIFGCNEINLEYVARHGQIELVFKEALNTCESNSVPFIAAFKKAKTYKIHNDGFTLFDEEGKVVLQAAIAQGILPTIIF